MSNKFSIADSVAAEMDTLMNSEEYKTMFAKPQIKFAAKDDDKEDKAKKEKEEKAKAKEKEDAKKEKEEAKAKKEKEDKKEKKASLPMPVALQTALDGILAVSELLEAANLEKSAAIATIALKSIFAEAEELAKAGKLITVVKLASDCKCSCSCDCKCDEDGCKCKDCDCDCKCNKGKEDDDDCNDAKDKCKKCDKVKCECKEKAEKEKKEKEEKDKKDKDDSNSANDMSFAKDDEDEEKEEDKDEEKEDEDEKEEEEDKNDAGLAGAEGDPLAGELGQGEAIQESFSDLAKQRAQQGKPSGSGYPQPETYDLPAFNQPRNLPKALTYQPGAPVPQGASQRALAPGAPQTPGTGVKPVVPSTMTRQRTPEGVEFGRGTSRKPVQIRQPMPGAPPAADDGAADDGGEGDPAPAAGDAGVSATSGNTGSVAPHVNAYPTDDTYADSGRNDADKDLPAHASNILNEWFVKMAQAESIDIGQAETEPPTVDIESLLAEISGEGEPEESDEDLPTSIKFESLVDEDDADAMPVDDIELETVASFREYLGKVAAKKKR